MSIRSPVSRAMSGATRARVLFGGGEAQAGWVMVGVGVAMVASVARGGLALPALGAVIGVLGAILAVVSGTRAIRLVRTGRLAEAALTRRRVLHGSGKLGRAYRVTFTFTDDRGARRELTADTQDPERFAADLWPVVYDDRRAHVLALLPGELRLVGDTVESGGWPLVAYLFFPAWALVATAILVLDR